MVTYLRGGSNTYPTSTSGGTIPDANRKIEVNDWAEALEPWVTPLLTDIGIGSPVDQRPFYWGQSKRVALTTTLSTSHTNNVATLSVAVGTGVLLQKYMVLELIDFVSGSTTIVDPTTKEIVIITAEPSGDTAAIARGCSGTTGVAHNSGCQVNIIGVAEPELQFHTLAPVSRGSQVFNYVQRFAGGVKADLAAQNMPTWENETNVMLSDYEDEMKKQKLLLEMSIWKGGRQAGDPTTPLGATFGGFDTFILTNVVNVGGARLTPRILESELRDLAKHVDEGPDGIRLLMSYDTAAIFDSLIDPIRMATAKDTELSLYTETIRFRFGAFAIGVSHNCPNGVIYGVRTKYMKVRPFAGANWHKTEIPGDVNGADHDQMFVSGDFTFQLEKEAAMFKLWNFDQDIDDYDSPFSN